MTDYVRPSDIARQLGISDSRVYELRDRLGAVRTADGRWRYPREGVEAEFARRGKAWSDAAPVRFAPRRKPTTMRKPTIVSARNSGPLANAELVGDGDRCPHSTIDHPWRASACSQCIGAQVTREAFAPSLDIMPVPAYPTPYRGRSPKGRQP
jgi:hypothetical protein